MQPDNLLRGGFRIPCERGAVNVYFTLAPTMPPKVQRLDFALMPNLAPAAQKEPSPREKQLALHLIDELSGPFDPAKHPDQYRSAVLAAVDEKVEAGEVSREEATEEAPAAGKSQGAQVIDLAELLSRSIKATGKPGPAKAKGDEEQEQAEAEPAKGKAKKGKRASG